MPYIPGWEIPKTQPEFFTNKYGLIVDYLAEYYREMCKRSFADAIDKYFKLCNNLNQRDVIAVRKTVSGQLKLLYSYGEFRKDDVRNAWSMHCRYVAGLMSGCRRSVVWSFTMCISATSTTTACKNILLWLKSRAAVYLSRRALANPHHWP
ncbi:BREX system Lon protease-like protein BrxL [Pontibacterium granulatum]|uniref:BREX system Lon protease-like protein BrxL n=1 Tax=Pontibacterium granulatum TaxID=2036029 RepID=UPI00249AFAAB|nr:BREX system Lon protease-like protein BrxL [Pontibacterium granulatum]MDI3325830.1 BREX system Lon protease-like protein BrxL [Pontibacterium granulatum]